MFCILFLLLLIYIYVALRMLSLFIIYMLDLFLVVKSVDILLFA